MRVGTRTSGERQNRRCKDHPHACGDKSVISGGSENGRGSSPCVWGQAKNHRPKTRSTRIIPMRVGTRADTGRGLSGSEDHPHACGDKPTTINYKEE